MVPLCDQQSHVFDVEKYTCMTSKGPVAILFARMTAKLFEGNLSLQGSFVCRFYVNNMLPEVLALQNRYWLAILVSDPVDPPNGDEPTTVEMVLFGTTAKENAFINAGIGFCPFVTILTRGLYGKQYELTISVDLENNTNLQRPDRIPGQHYSWCSYNCIRILYVSSMVAVALYVAEPITPIKTFPRLLL